MENKLQERSCIIYGAYGFTGKLVVQQALAAGLRPLLAGRNAAKTKTIADGYNLEFVAFDVSEASAYLQGAKLLINCAGPFTRTAEPLMDACIKERVHYLDVTGEIPVFEAAWKRDEQARKAGVILCPGVGFDTVPTDCLAALLKQALPDANRLELAFDFGTLPSQGTARTALGGVGDGCLIRENGALKTVSMGYRVRKIPFPNKSAWAVSMPWGDVVTAYRSTGIPNLIVYAALPLVVGISFKLTNPLRNVLALPSMQKKLNWLVGKVLSEGPDEKTRAETRTRFWGQVSNPNGKTYSATLTGPSVYDMTAELAVACAEAGLAGQRDGGYYTASMLVGAEFLSNRKGYQLSMDLGSN